MVPLPTYEAIAMEASTLHPLCFARGGGTILGSIRRSTEETRRVQRQRDHRGCTTRALLRSETTSAISQQARSRRCGRIQYIGEGVLQVASHGFPRAGEPSRICGDIGATTDICTI